MAHPAARARNLFYAVMSLASLNTGPRGFLTGRAHRVGQFLIGEATFDHAIFSKAE